MISMVTFQPSRRGIGVPRYDHECAAHPGFRAVGWLSSTDRPGQWLCTACIEAMSNPPKQQRSRARVVLRVLRSVKQ